MRRYFIHFISAVAATVGLIGGTNILLDPYRVFGNIHEVEAFEPNTRYYKTNLIHQQCKQYNAYIFGNSRAVVFDPKAINDKQLNFFNFGVSDDKINGIYEKIKFIFDENCAFKVAIIPISLDLIGVADWDSQGNLLRMEHPLVSHASEVGFYSKYLVSTASPISYIKASLSGTHVTRYYSNGFEEYGWEINREDFSDCSASLPQDKVLLSNIESDLNVHMSVAGELNNKGIRTVLVLVPMPRKKFEIYNSNKHIREYLKSLEEIYHDAFVMDNISDYADDYRYWHDCGHFKSSVFMAYLAPKIRERIDQNFIVGPMNNVQR